MSNLTKRRNELRSWLLEKGYISEMVRKQTLQVCEHSRESLFEIVISECDKNCHLIYL